MLNLDFLAGLSSPLLFLKATSKKQVWIPPFTRADGTYVAGHMAFVHVADNHDDAKVAAGDGTHSQKAAHAKLSKEDWFHQLPTDHKAAVVLKHATELQDAASASAALSVFKKAVLAGQPPKAAGWKAFGALPKEKREAFIAEVKAAGKDAHFLAELQKHLGVAPSPVPGPPHAAEEAPTPAPAPVPAPAPAAAPAELKTGAVLKLDSQYQKMNAGQWKIYNQDADQYYLHKLGAKVPNQSNSATIPKATMHEAMAVGTAKVVSQDGAAPQKPTPPKVVAASAVPAALQVKAAISGAKLPSENTNAKSFNPKVDKILAALDAGDAHALLGMSFGTNTYGKKAAALANHALAALGSPHKVAHGQKAGEHAALAGAAATPAPGPVAAPAPSAGPAALATVGLSSVTASVGGKQVVAAADGKPQVFYHGAPAKLDGGKLKEGSFFALDAAHAKTYAAEHDGGKVHEVNLALKNPATPADIVAAAKAAGVDLNDVQGYDEDVPEAAAFTMVTASQMPPGAAQKVIDKLKQQGFDGAAFPNDFTAGGASMKSVMVFGADQIVPAQASAPAPAPAPTHAEAMAAATRLSFGGWDLEPSDDGFGGNPVLAYTDPKDGVTYYLSKNDEGEAYVTALKDDGDVHIDHGEGFENVEQAAEFLQEVHGVKVPASAVATLTNFVVGSIPADPPAAPALPKPPADIADLSQSKKALKLAENGDVPGLQAYHAKLLGEKTKAYAAQLLTALGAAPAPAAAPAAPAAKLFVGLPASAIPMKPMGVSMATWDKAVSFASTGNMPALQKLQQQLKAKAMPVPKTAGAVSALIDQLVAHQQKPGGSVDAGPKEGDTKVEGGVTYVLKNGRWHKVEAPAAAAPAPAAKSSDTVVSHVYENTTENHDKFWAVAVDGSHMHLAWGKNGTKGQTKIKEFASPGAAHAAMHKLIKEKTGDGYVKQYSEPVAGFAPAAAAKPAPKVVAATKADATVATPAPAVAPAASPADGAPVSIDSWKQVGPQGGYNPGGTFVDEHGQHWYCKFPAGGEKVAKNELLASKLYELAGIAVPAVKLVTQGGKVGLASKIIAGAVKDKAALLEGKAPGILSGFAVDAWLANWDTVGNNPAAGKGFDNILIGPGGKAYRIDAGGALMYGGAGGKKQKFGNEVIELKTMLDPKKNANTAAVFGKMTPADVTASVASVVAISDEQIKALVLAHGPGSLADRLELTATLIARKHNMLAQYPAAAKAALKPKPKAAKKPIVFDPSKLGAAPDFMNWKGPGQHGPASMKEKNEANQAGVNELLKVAQAGNIQAIKDHKLPFYAPDGSVSHMVTPLNHPSQYVKGYAQQLINEIDAQLNPPKPFRWDGASPLAALHSAYPKVKNILAAGVEKLGYYVKLGKPGIIKAEDLALPAKATWANGKLNRKTYAAAAQAVTAKLPQQQKDALKSYTGAGYHEINHSLWKGNPVGAAKSAEEALMTLGHDIAAGTILSRKIGIHGADLEALQKSVGSVLQEPAVMSTSLRPSCWGGNVHFKLTVGPGVKGLYVGPGSTGPSSALSKNASEDEMLLPPNTRLLVQAVRPGKKGDDPDGFGEHSDWIVEVLVLPTH